MTFTQAVVEKAYPHKVEGESIFIEREGFLVNVTETVSGARICTKNRKTSLSVNSEIEYNKLPPGLTDKAGKMLSFLCILIFDHMNILKSRGASSDNV